MSVAPVMPVGSETLDQQPVLGPEARRILMVMLNYAPDLVGCAKYNSELAEDLAARGHQVEVVTAPPYYPAWRIGDSFSGARWSREERQGVVVHRTPLYVPPKPNGVRRVAHLASFGAAALPTAVAVARRLRPDLVFAVAPTLAAAGAALAAARVSGASSWLHIQDFEVEAAFDLGLLSNRRARAAALGLEARLMQAFDRVSTISPAMVERLAGKGVAEGRRLEFRNWVDVDAIPVFANSNTTYRRELDIAPDEIVALYSGNMAAKQGLEALGEVAAQLAQARAPVTLLLCGDGPARAALESACSGLASVRFLPLQPLERLGELLATADIHLLPQRPEAADLVLPSKLTGMLASGRPVVAMAAPDSGLAEEVQGCGLAVAATAHAMTEAVLTLAADPDTRRRLGVAARLRAEERWKKSAIIDGFEAAADRLPRP